MSNIYCGNNANHPELINGKKNLGTLKNCLQKGIGVGFNMPYDQNYGEEYIPIDTAKVYCGDSEDLPDNYDEFGTLKECYSRGIGIGKARKAQLGKPKFYRYIIPFLLAIMPILIFFGLLYYYKPFFIIKNDTEELKKQKIIDWYKFIPILILFSIIIYYIVYKFYKFT